MDEMKRRGYSPDEKWYNCNYRGNILGLKSDWCNFNIVSGLAMAANKCNMMIYPEHDDIYLQECIENLKEKGIEILNNYYKATIKDRQDVFLMAETESEARFKIKCMSDFKDIKIDDIKITFIPDENRPNPILLAEKDEYWGRWIWCSKCGGAVSPEWAKYCCYCGKKFVNIQKEEVNE